MQERRDLLSQEGKRGNDMWDKIQDMLLEYGESLLLALLAVIIGTILIKKVLMPLVTKILAKGKADETIKHFLRSFINVALYVALVVIVMSYLKIDMTSALAFLGSCGVAIGLALQDTLANIAGGIFVLFTKPYVIGDYVEVDNIQGIVTDITLLHTKLDTVDNKAIFVPNNQMSSSKLTNYSREETRRLDLKFSISYDSDFRKAKDILIKIADEHPMILKDPAPIIRVGELADSSVNLVFRVWVPTVSYWDVNFDVIEQVKLTFDKEGIHIPFNQMDVHIKNK